MVNIHIKLVIFSPLSGCKAPVLSLKVNVVREDRMRKREVVLRHSYSESPKDAGMIDKLYQYIRKRNWL